MDKIKYCALAAHASSACTDLGLSKKETGRPVAMARRPTKPAPASEAPNSWRRFKMLMLFLLQADGDGGGRKARHDEGGFERVRGLCPRCDGRVVVFREQLRDGRAVRIRRS